MRAAVLEAPGTTVKDFDAAPRAWQAQAEGPQTEIGIAFS